MLVTASIWSILRIFAGQGFFVEDLAFSTSDQTWVSIDAGDQTVAISRHSISGIRHKTVVDGVRWNGRWTLESNDGFRVACFKHLIGPLASMDFVIVNKSCVAMFWVWFSVGTLVIGSRACVAVWIDSEQVFTAWSRDWRLVSCEFAVATVDGPVVVAMVVDSAFAIKQQTIFARFQCQGSICAEEKLVTMVGMQIGLFTVWFWTLWDAGGTAYIE